MEDWDFLENMDLRLHNCVDVLYKYINKNIDKFPGKKIWRKHFKYDGFSIDITVRRK